MGAELLVLGILPLVPPMPGDVDNAPTASSACFINPYTNDVFGHTDKLVTHAVAAGCGGDLNRLIGGDQEPSKIGFSTSLNWRMVTPIFKTNRAAQPLKESAGNYADWVEFQNGLGRAFLLGTQQGYAQISLSLHDISPKGGEAMQNKAHRIFGLKSRYTWTNELRRRTLGSNLESGALWHLGNTETWTIRAGLGWNDSPLLAEPYAMTRLSWTQPNETPINMATVALLAARPQTSQIVPLAHHTRYSLSLTLHYAKHCYSAFTLSTPYVQRDNFRQIGIMPLGVIFDL